MQRNNNTKKYSGYKYYSPKNFSTNFVINIFFSYTNRPTVNVYSKHPSYKNNNLLSNFKRQIFLHCHGINRGLFTLFLNNKFLKNLYSAPYIVHKNGVHPLLKFFNLVKILDLLYFEIILFLLSKVNFQKEIELSKIFDIVVKTFLYKVHSSIMI